MPYFLDFIMQIFSRFFASAIVVSTLFLTGCFPGVNVDGLQLPSDALTDYSNKKTKNFSIISRAIEQTADIDKIERKASLNLDTEELIELLSEITKHKTTLGILDADIADLTTLFQNVQTREQTNTKDARFEIAKSLHGQLKANTAFRHIVAALTAHRASYSFLAARFPELFLIRLKNELWHIGVPLIRDFAETCQTESDAITRDLLKTARTKKFKEELTALVDSLNRAVLFKNIEFAELDGIQIGITTFESLEDLQASVRAKFGTNDVALGRQLILTGSMDRLRNNVLRIHKTKIKSWKAMYRRLLVEGGGRKIKPPVFGEQIKNTRAANGLADLAEKRKKNKKPVLFATAKDSDIRILAEYVTLKKDKGLVVNLAAIAKEAHTLSLSEENFVNWVASTINKRLKSHFILVRELDALAYTDEPGKKGKKASIKKNLLAILEKLEGFVAFAATPSQEYVTQDKKLKKYLIEPMTFDLWQINALVKKAMEINKTPDDKDSVMAIARIIRGARNTFSLGLLHDGCERFFKKAKKKTLNERRPTAEQVGRTLMKKESTEIINAILTSHIDTIELGLEKNGPLYFAQSPRVDNPNNGIGTMLVGGGTGKDIKKAEERAKNYTKELVELVHRDAMGMGEGILDEARLHADNLADAERNTAIARENKLAHEIKENRMHIDYKIASTMENARKLVNEAEERAHADTVELLDRVIEDLVDIGRLNAAVAELRLNQQELGEDFDERLAAANHHHEDKRHKLKDDLTRLEGNVVAQMGDWAIEKFAEHLQRINELRNDQQNYQEGVEEILIELAKHMKIEAKELMIRIMQNASKKMKRRTCVRSLNTAAASNSLQAPLYVPNNLFTTWCALRDLAQ